MPSQIELATSDASARVGTASSIIDSSIWVAVMTGMPRRFALRMIVFWIGGTSSGGSSTPEVAARHHHAVAGRQDRVQLVDRLGLLQLRDQRDGFAVLAS